MTEKNDRHDVFKKSAFVAVVVALGGVSRAGAAEGGARKPNIVYVLTDQWRAKATGYDGDVNVKTPNLDRLARESVNFRNAVSVCPVCTPHRAALMTGRFPLSTGMFVNDLYLPSDELCMAEIFKSAGYDTAYIGKWHLDGHGRTDFIPPERRQGWDYWKGAECDHNYNKSHYYEGNSPDKKFWPGYDAYAQTKDAQQYLQDHARSDRPFILMVAYGTPHFPHQTAPAELKELYPPEKIILPPNVPPALEAAARKEAQGYYAHCTALDRCVGELLTTLSTAGLDSNTVFVFTSDHGEMLGSHGRRPFLKQAAWDESARVPFLLRMPGAPARTVATPLTTPDVLPTLLGLAGLGKPGTLEGVDLSATVRGGPEMDHAALYMAVNPFSVKAVGPPYRAVRTATHTFVRYQGASPMLIDDVKDPFQMENLAGIPEFAAVQRDMEMLLDAELKRVHDDFPTPEAALKRWNLDLRPEASAPYSEKAGVPEKIYSPRRGPAG